MKNISLCAKCPFQLDERVCRNPNGKAPDFCATIKEKEILEKAEKMYAEPETQRFAHEAALQEASKCGIRGNIPSKTRLIEIMEFAKRMGFTHLGLAFCGGLRKEAKIVNEIFELNGFTVTSAMCKVGSLDCSVLGVEKADDRTVSVCNPIGQAEILNAAETQLNVVLGLCVGHDSLFTMYSKAPSTVLAVKDRVLCHNPLGAIYTMDNSYRILKAPVDFDKL